MNKLGLNAERGLPSPLCTLPMQFYTLPTALSTGSFLSLSGIISAHNVVVNVWKIYHFSANIVTASFEKAIG